MKVEGKGEKKVVSLRWSIGTKLTILILAMVIIPMFAISYYNLSESQDEISKIARDNLMELSRGTSCQIEQLLIENQRTSATMAGEPIVVQFLTASEEERQGLEPQLYETLQNYADTHPDYDAPGILDVNGIVVASLAEQLRGRNRSFRDYFQASIQGESYVSGILVGRATGRPGVFLTNPVITAEGEIVGINIVWLKGNAIWDIIDDVVIGDEGIAYLLDSDGVIIAHPDRDLLYHSLGELTPEAKEEINSTIRFGTINGTNTPLIPESLGMGDLADELALTEGSGSFLFRSPLDNRDHVVGYTSLEEYSLTVIVDLPKEQFMAPMQQLESIAWLSVWLVMVIVLIVSVLLVRSITHPIRHLANTAMAVVDHSQPFDPSDIEDVTLGHDEIAHLGRMFSDMVVSLQQELTKRKQSEGKIKDILESSPDAITVTDLQGTITECNEATLRVHNFSSKEEIIGKNAFTLFPKREQKRATENLKKTLKEGSAKNIEYALLKKEGEEFPAEVSASIINDVSRKPIAFVAITKDITERKNADEKLRKLKDELEIKVAERTKELEEKVRKLDKSQKANLYMIEDLNETSKELKAAQENIVRSEKLATIGKLAGIMGHEIRNPLGVIKNSIYFLNMKLKDSKDEKIEKHLNILQTEIDNSDKIISDVLDFASIKTPTLKEAEINDVVKETLSKATIPKAVKVKTELGAKLPKLKIDTAQIGMVFANIISNAVQAMPKGGEIKVTTSKVDEFIAIAFKDTGIGIPKENLDKIFEPLVSTKVNGIGLGLTACQSIIKDHKGKIEVKNKEVGKGVIFTVKLPVA